MSAHKLTGDFDETTEPYVWRAAYGAMPMGKVARELNVSPRRLWVWCTALRQKEGRARSDASRRAG